jgi:Xaa-Pro aminopeptidase
VAALSKSAGSSRSQAQSRIGRLRLTFSDLKSDALLVTHLPNIQYLCSFTGSAGLLLIESERATLFTDSRYTYQAREEVVGARVQIASGGLLAAGGKALKRHRRLALAYAPAQLTVAQLDALQAAIGKRIRWVKAPNAVEKLRAIKDETELQAIRDAAVLISNVFQDVVSKIRPGISELDLSAEIEFAMKRAGASGPSFETIVAGGPRSAWAHARPSSKPLAKNELVVLDQGAILRAYCSDMTRTVFLGRPSEKVRDMYGAVLEAQAAAKSAIRPGATAGHVDAAARKVLKARSLALYFTHSTGHGLGLEVHETPRLGRGDKTVLQQGMVLTVEPGVYIEGLGGVRIEDDVVVTSSGAKDLTTAPRELLEL